MGFTHLIIIFAYTLLFFQNNLGFYIITKYIIFIFSLRIW